MKNRRLKYRVILKILTGSALMILVWVFVNSLFTQSVENVGTTDKGILKEIDLSDMKKGEIRKTRLGNYEVSILFRDTSVPVEMLKSIKQSNTILHLEDNHYFVYFNHGDSGNCPLFYSKNTLKDVCSGTVFDTTGREISNKDHGYKIMIPAHYYSGKHLFLGQWAR